MIKGRRVLLAAAVLIAGTAAAWAETTAAGVWETIDDKTGKVRSTVTISRSGPVFIGRVTQVFPARGEPIEPRCDKCPGGLRGLPMKGLQIIEGMRQSGLTYSDGTILDPESGKIYSATMTLSADGAHLTVRGYIGISAFGRSQVWNRIR